MNGKKMGRAHVFGANVTTDDILPGKYLDRSNDEVGPFAMAGIDPAFATKVIPGDFLVAGENFGMGSGRESAPMAIKHCGIAAVIAPGFSRLFYRSAINLGLPAIMVPSTEGIVAGTVLEVDFAARLVRLREQNRTIPFLNITGTARAILEAGGILPFTKQRLLERKGQPSPASIATREAP